MNARPAIQRPQATKSGGSSLASSFPAALMNVKDRPERTANKNPRTAREGTGCEILSTSMGGVDMAPGLLRRAAQALGSAERSPMDTVLAWQRQFRDERLRLERSRSRRRQDRRGKSAPALRRSVLRRGAGDELDVDAPARSTSASDYARPLRQLNALSPKIQQERRGPECSVQIDQSHSVICAIPE
jgi:hypothetical protein